MIPDSTLQSSLCSRHFIPPHYSLSHPAPPRQMQPLPQPRDLAPTPALSRQPGVTLKFYTIITVQNSLRPKPTAYLLNDDDYKMFLKRVLIGLKCICVRLSHNKTCKYGHFFFNKVLNSLKRIIIKHCIHNQVY